MNTLFAVLGIKNKRYFKRFFLVLTRDTSYDHIILASNEYVIFSRGASNSAWFSIPSKCGPMKMPYKKKYFCISWVEKKWKNNCTFTIYLNVYIFQIKNKMKTVEENGVNHFLFIIVCLLKQPKFSNWEGRLLI